MTDCDKLEETIRSGKRLVVYLHDNPDPDCIAAGWILSRIAIHLDVRARIVYGGRLGRAENRTLVKLLKVPLHRLDSRQPRHLRTDRYAMVDTQPGTGNNSFPREKLRCHIVIDHHPKRPDLTADLVDIRPEEGCSTTMLLGYHQACGLTLDADLATACAYAILSETQDLDRETTRADREAYTRLLPHVRLRILGRIRHPVHERDYYRTIARAMRNVMVGKNTCVCHIGPVHKPETVAEVADLLVAMDRISWCLTTGLHEGQMILSIRSTDPRAKAEKVMRRILGKMGKGGGHGMIAGGQMPCTGEEEYRELAGNLTGRFLTRLGRRVPENLKPLLDEPD
jgi:nanoRNase/pAp phosphatase (c-di-AMP/oligoRNAs hydrolase)